MKPSDEPLTVALSCGDSAGSRGALEASAGPCLSSYSQFPTRIEGFEIQALKDKQTEL